MTHRETVGPSELAEALGVSERHVYRLARLGMPKDGRGEYPVVRCARWYREHVLSPGGAEGDGPDLGEARLRKAKAAALRAERELATRREEVIPAAVWYEVTAEVDAWLRGALLGLAPEWAEALEGVEDPREISEVLRREVRSALETLQAGPPGWEDPPPGEKADERAA